MTSYNVFLTGGGMKGAYQYGFFKKLYQRWPDFPIKRVYAVSVGAINALPVVTRKMHLLDEYWCNEKHMPFDMIANDWDYINNAPTDAAKISLRSKSLMLNGSLFESLNLEPFEKFIDCLDENQLHDVREKLVIFSHNIKTKRPVVTRCTSKAKILEGIRTSSMFPHLFKVDSDVIDGSFNDLDKFIRPRKGEEWLCLDLQGMLQVHPEAFVFAPKVSNYPVANIVSCLVLNRKLVDKLIRNGEDDAELFVDYERVLRIQK
jgi:hypothetical protein